MGLLRVLFIVFVSLLVDAAGPIALSAAPDSEELQEQEGRRVRRPHAVRPHRVAASSPVAIDLSAVARRPRTTVAVPRRLAPGRHALKVPPLVADSPSSPEDH